MIADSVTFVILGERDKMFKWFRAAVAASGILVIMACGNTYAVTSVDAATAQRAQNLFNQTRAEGPRSPRSTGAAKARFNRVARRIEPVAENYCNRLLADQPNFNCNAKIEIDPKLKSRNAYFTYDGRTPVVRFSMPLLQDAANDHEIAFIMGHEYGHLIGRHVEKRAQQQLAGALILGAIAAASTDSDSSSDQALVRQSVGAGIAIGTVAYSQTYELESDTLGTHIAYAAGYDPVIGAKYFARPEPQRTADGKLSFWGTHPPNVQRMATVLATVQAIERGEGVVRQ